MERNEAASVIKELMAQNLDVVADSFVQARKRLPPEVLKSLDFFQLFERQWQEFLKEYSSAVTVWWSRIVSESCKDPAAALKLWTGVFNPMLREGCLVAKKNRIQVLNEALSHNATLNELELVSDWADKVLDKHMIHVVFVTNSVNEQTARVICNHTSAHDDN